jgi:hypothetical protein
VEPFFQGFRLPFWISWAAPLAALGVAAILGFLIVLQRVRAGLLAVPPVPARPVQSTLQPNQVPSVDTTSKTQSAPTPGANFIHFATRCSSVGSRADATWPA